MATQPARRRLICELLPTRCGQCRCRHVACASRTQHHEQACILKADRRRHTGRATTPHNAVGARSLPHAAPWVCAELGVPARRNGCVHASADASERGISKEVPAARCIHVNRIGRTCTTKSQPTSAKQPSTKAPCRRPPLINRIRVAGVLDDDGGGVGARLAGNVSGPDSTTASVDGQSIAKKSRTITFGAMYTIQNPMPNDIAAKHDDMALRSARSKPRQARPCSKCDPILDEHSVTIMREAGAKPL